MKVREIVSIIDGEILTGHEAVDLEIFSACGADLMSDVVSGNDYGMLVTGLVNPQVVRTAELMDIKVICFIKGKQVNTDIINLAKEKEIILLKSDKSMFITCGQLYRAGLERGEATNE